jgi:rRNA-processing protein FCF1
VINLYITKKEFNIIKTLKRFLSVDEYKDFKQLLKNKNVNRCIIIIDNNVIMEYYKGDIFIYSMQIERTIGFKTKLEIEKTNIDLLEKLLRNKDIVALVKQLKDYDSIHANPNEVSIYKDKYVIRIPLKPMLKNLRVMNE